MRKKILKIKKRKNPRKLPNIKADEYAVYLIKTIIVYSDNVETTFSNLLSYLSVGLRCHDCEKDFDECKCEGNRNDPNKNVKTVIKIIAFVIMI